MEGIDLFETFAPVVQWTTVILMLIIEFLLGFKSKKGDVTADFLHAYIPTDEKVYVEIPIGFEQFSKYGRTKCLKLKNTLYGIYQSLLYFWQYMTKKLDQSGLNKSNLDPCLSFGEKGACFVYVDNLIFWARNEDDIHNLDMHF